MSVDMAARWAGLPPELVEHIIQFAIRDDIKTCAAFCLTDRVGRSLATPYLYRCVGIPTEMKGHQDRSHRLQRLCLTLLARPEFTRYVEEVHQYLSKDMAFPETSAIPAADWTYWSTAALCGPLHSLRADGGHFLREFRDTCSRGVFSNHHCFLLLLAMCNRLKTLTLTGDVCLISRLERLSTRSSETGPRAQTDQQTRSVPVTPTFGPGSVFSIAPSVPIIRPGSARSTAPRSQAQPNHGSGSSPSFKPGSAPSTPAPAPPTLRPGLPAPLSRLRDIVLYPTESPTSTLLVDLQSYLELSTPITLRVDSLMPPLWTQM